LRTHTCIFGKKDVTSILSVLRWDGSRGEDLRTIPIPSTSLNGLLYCKFIGKF